MLISPNTTVASSCDDERTTQLNIHFLVEPPYASVAPGVFMFSLKPNLKALVDEVFALSAAGEGAPDRRYSMLFLRIILAALMELPEDSLSKHPLDPRIDAAMRLLRQGRQQAVDNQELAKRAGLSLNAFLRLFRQQAGTSPQKYQRQCRVEQACLLLHYSDLNIEEIAEKTGFCDRYHFSRIFKSLRGTGPAGFRKLIAPSG